ncbi:hypothetical protein EJ06DRAFT_556961 [Trichodelitschia bisporula]|uniref:BYS1 domain protein n=1 Tax=Trichodelitschia bisporula TaxID=703511 RepID=A0A6G1HVA6_9PEZI|nr:hypothetical protein EJ06DRAFT_556961 [Trichodelitschia bisporula]
MHFSMRAAAVAALLPLSLAGHAVARAGNAVVRNNCGGGHVYLWSVGSEMGAQKDLFLQDQTYSEPYRFDKKTGGIAIKLTPVESGIFKGAAQLNFAYTFEGDRIWYDLSSVFGNAFPETNITLAPSDPSCPTIVWPNGVHPVDATPHACSSKADIVLTLCGY